MRKSRIGIFITITFAIFALSHLVVYEGVAAVFGIGSGTLKFIFVLLALSFVCAQSAVSKWENFFTKVFYRAAAVWIGFLTYFFLATVGYGLAALVLSGSALGNLGYVLFAVALVIGTYGLLHSQSIRVKKYEIALKNLPDVWKGRKLVWLSDLHLGQIRGKSFAERVVQVVNSLKPDIIFIGGDLYDGVVCDEVDIIEPLRNLEAPLGTIFITGNHDGFSDKATSKDITIIKNAGLGVLRDEKLEIDGLQILGADYKHTEKLEDFRTVLKRLNIDRSKPSILLKHVPSDIPIAEEAGVSLVICGHTHQAQMWPFRFLPKKIYKGFDYGLAHSGETQVLTSSGVGTWGPPVRVGTNSEVVLISLR